MAGSTTPEQILLSLLFTWGDVRNAVLELTDCKALSQAQETELQNAVSRYYDALRGYYTAVVAGHNLRARARFYRLLKSFDARWVCYIRANRKRKAMTFDQIKSEAALVNLRIASGERVKAVEQAKTSGGIRVTCRYGNRARAAQQLITDLIFVGAGPSPFEYARKGRGRDTAILAVLQSTIEKGVKWFGLADIKDCFGSITRKMVRRVLPFIPQSVLNATIFIPEETDISYHPYHKDKDHRSAQAIRTALPQGSISSSIVASKVLQPHLEKLGARFVAIHVDDVLIGGETEEEVRTILKALASSLEKQPDGSLRLTSSMFELGDYTMNYLGYRIRRRSLEFGGGGRAQPSDRSFSRFNQRLASRLLLSCRDSWVTEIEKECARYVRSFPAWSTRHRCEDYAFINAVEDLWPIVRGTRDLLQKNRCRWNSFEHLRREVNEVSAYIATLVPKLFTKDGDPALNRDLKLFSNAEPC